MRSAECDVLVVDDEAVVRSGIARVLADEGLVVVGVQDASSALGHPALGTCRLLLCDIMLPDRPGIELLRAIRAQRRDLPMICITGYATQQHVQEAMAAGAAAFLPKPFDQDELLDVVRRALATTTRPREED